MKKSWIAVLSLLIVLSVFYFIPTHNGGSEAGFSTMMPDFGDDRSIPASNQGIFNLQDLNNAIVKIANRSNKAVVTILTSETVRRQPTPFDQFFGMQGQREFQRRGLGSGVIVSKDGYILTNNHVVQGADSIRVRLIDDQDYAVDVIGRDPQTDIAVLKLSDQEANFDYLSLGNSDQLQIGEFVLAIGSPLDDQLAHTVTMGIVSAKGRPAGPAIVEDENGNQFRAPSLAEYIQTDAAINPGNSGGALIDMNGRLVGINSAIASRTGGFQGIGFAVPVNIAEKVMTSLIEHGRVIRGFLGVIPQDIDPNMAKALGLEKRGGVLLADVSEDTPAEEHGLKAGDVIIRMNGERVKNQANFRVMIASLMPDEQVEFDLIRDGKEKTISVTIGEREDDLSASINQDNYRNNNSSEALPDMGIRVSELNAELMREFDLDNGTEGVVVTGVKRGSVAANTLRQGDVIIKIGSESVSNLEEYEAAVRKAQRENRDVVLVRFIRGEYAMYGTLEME